jgi:hypothetical protein
MIQKQKVNKSLLLCQELLLTLVPGPVLGTTLILTTSSAKVIIKSKTIKYAFIRIGFN